MPSLMKRACAGFLLAAAILMLTACRTPPAGSAENSNGGISLLEQRLLDVIEMDRKLVAASEEPNADPRDIQRRFHIVVREYEGIIARNPRHLETRLLFGKLLSRFGDGQGARDQFLSAAQIDPAIAVIHQELSTYYAEEEDFTRALAYALNAIRLEPETAAYHFGLGQLLAAFRDPFLAESVFTSEQLDAEMLKAFATARDLEPENLAFQFRYGEAFYDVEEPDWNTALAHWNSLAGQPTLSPIQADAVRVHQARCLLELDRPEEARQMVDSVHSDLLRASANSLFPEP